MKIVRDHDKLYLNENRKANPKEYFKFIASIVKPHVNNNKAKKILDIGCATGDFVYYLKALFPEAKITGMDVVPELLARARRECPDVNFIEADVFNGKGLPEEKFNFIFMNGVHSIFDEIEPFMDNIFNMLADNGRVYIFGMFNPLDYDVLVKVKPSGSPRHWESGWNCFSQKTFIDYLERNDIRGKFHNFQIGIDIEPNTDDGLRSWTFKLEDGRRAVVNGTQVLHHFSLLEIATD